MPRYFIDISEGDTLIADADGLDVPNVQAAEDEAVVGLTTIAGAPMIDLGSRKLLALVRDERGEILRRVTLTLEIERWAVGVDLGRANAA